MGGIKLLYLEPAKELCLYIHGLFAVEINLSSLAFLIASAISDINIFGKQIYEWPNVILCIESIRSLP